MALSQLGDVDEALDAVLDADEGAEGNQLGDLAGDDLADGMRAGECLPRVLLGRLERQGDALAVEIASRTSTVTSVPTSTTSEG